MGLNPGEPWVFKVLQHHGEGGTDRRVVDDLYYTTTSLVTQDLSYSGKTEAFVVCQQLASPREGGAVI